MAFHFNWSPLIADTDRVRQMLTSSLNKTPKPPIIVDDIIVNELNLGSNPPSLEILDVGDLAADRFRGIFKVKYEGDAYLTLKTRVQANPLNTFLSTKPSFASPNPLAAGSSLTIPLQITLSDIRLSGFVTLVFNRQKGITLVFQNDPLESLKVSSTFDSIPFVRDYLQKTIEAQLRVLFMEDLPAIIHRLSLRSFGPESENDEHHELRSGERDISEQTHPVKNYPSTDAVVDEDALLDASSLLDIPAEMFASFSPKSLLSLAALNESQRTLSLFTPAIEDAVYRAGVNAPNRNIRQDDQPTPLQRPVTFTGIQSSFHLTNDSPRTSIASSTSDGQSQLSRPSMSSLPSHSTTYSFASGRTRTHTARKRKHRIVNLRKNAEVETDGASDAVTVSSGYEDSASRSESFSPDGSTNAISGHESTVRTSLPATSVHPKEREGEVQTPHGSPKKKTELERAHLTLDDVIAGAENTGTLRPRPTTPRYQSVLTLEESNVDQTPYASNFLRPEKSEQPVLARGSTLPLPEHSKRPSLPRSVSELSISDLVSAFPMHGGSSGGILEQAWMMKMATEIAKRVAQEKEKHSGQWSAPRSPDGSGEPPPAYVS